MKSNNSRTPYENAVSNGCALLIDLLAQIVNLIVSLQREIDSLETGKKGVSKKENDSKKTGGSEISVRALSTSIVFLQFSTLETISNFLAELTIETSKGLAGAPEIATVLTQAEIDLLAEQRTYVDTGTGEIKVNSSAFVPTIEKLALVPLLFGKLHGRTYRLDKSGKGWQNVLKLKEIRDKFTHSRLNMSSLAKIEPNLGNIKPTVEIENKDLFIGAEAIRWYLQQIVTLLKQVYTESHKQLLFNLLALQDVLCWMMLANLYKSVGISEKVFYRDYSPPMIKQLE